MTDKDKIKFAIRYLKQGLKSKRTPPLYEELMKELGFEENDKVQKLEKENAELREELNYAESHCLFHSDCPTQKENESLENIKNIYIGDLLKAKEIIKELVRVEYADFTNGDYSNELSKVLEQAEQFLNSEVEND